MTEQQTSNLPAVRPKVPVALAQPLGDMDQAWRAAGILARSRLLPDALYAKSGNPEQTQANVTLVLWYGAELGLPPMQAIQNIYIVKGKPQLSGQLWLSKVREHGHKAFVACKHCDRAPEQHPAAGNGDHRYDKDHDETRCTVTIIRSDGDRHSETFTIQDAVRGGLCTIRDGRPYSRSNNGNPQPWETWTKRMLQWRATSTCATTICPEVALGYGMEGDEIVPDADGPTAEQSLAQAVDARTQQANGAPAEPAEPADVHDADIVTDPDAEAAREAADAKRQQEILDIEREYAEDGEPLLDPDCVAGKCDSCSGPPCQHECHTGGRS